MKAITLTQPWASLVAIGAKKIETRSWSTHYRGPIAIHAAKGFPKWAKEFAGSRMVLDLMRPHVRDDMPYLDQLPLGCVIATANMVRCVTTEVITAHIQPFTEQEYALGDYLPRRFGFLLEDVVRLDEPIPAKGALSLWDWDHTSMEEKTK